MPADLSVEVIAKVPSRYYQVPRHFVTVLTVAHNHNRWYRPTLLGTFCMYILCFNVSNDVIENWDVFVNNGSRAWL